MASELKPQGGQVVVAGSLAFDNIMDFPGAFKDHILQDKVHVINISFLVKDLTRQYGGCAANIAYTLALLDTDSRIVAAAGSDFGDYRAKLSGEGIDVDGIHCFDGEMTASCFITTDKDDCQITGFYPGAMRRAGEISLAKAAGDNPGLCMVAPDDPDAMIRHCKEAQEAGIPLLFDPSFQVTAMEGEWLARAAKGAYGLFVNDYEFTVFQEKTGLSADELRAAHELIVVTYGDKGSKLLRKNGEDLVIPAAKATEVVDPTGAGDAYRGGFMAGVMRGYRLEVCGRMGSVAAAYAVEK